MCKLTSNQKKLVHLIEQENLEQAAAYVEAGYAGNDNVQVVRSNVQNELNKTHVAAYRSELKAKLQESAEQALNITKVGNLKTLEKIKNQAIEGSFKKVVMQDSKGVVRLDNKGNPLTTFSYIPADLNTAIKIIQEQNKMLGFYEAEKIDHSMTVTALTKQDIDVQLDKFDALDASVLNDE
jgi:hypothetical protein